MAKYLYLMFAIFAWPLVWCQWMAAKLERDMPGNSFERFKAFMHEEYKLRQRLDSLTKAIKSFK